MESFEALGVGPELRARLREDGIVSPTPLQVEAIPLLARGNGVVLRAGPGAGVLLAYGLPLLQRAEEMEEGAPRILVVTATADEASERARALARLLPAGSPIRVAALDRGWNAPRGATILCVSAEALLGEVRSSRIDLSIIEIFVVDGIGKITGLGSLPALRTLAETLPAGAQRIFLGLPLRGEAEAFVDAHGRRMVHLPPRPVEKGPREEVPHRGSLLHRTAAGAIENELLDVLDALFAREGVRHALLFLRTEKEKDAFAALLAIHGFTVGEPGASDARIWLAVEERTVRSMFRALPDPDAVATVSVGSPFDADALDRRHGAGGPGAVLVLPRELPHLRGAAGEAGYVLQSWPPSAEDRDGSAATLNEFRARIETAMDSEGVMGGLAILEPLLQRHDPVNLAAAAITLLLRKTAEESSRSTSPGGPLAGPASAGSAPPPAGQAWVRLFLTIGEKDGVTARDLVGAITGEAGVEGKRVGKVEIRDTFSRIEVEEKVAGKIVKALNGTSIRGRAVRADYDRPAPQRGGGAPRGGGRPPGRRPPPR